MRLIRFLDHNNQIRHGLQQDNSSALPLPNDFLGPLHPSGPAMPFRKILAPIIPTNIFCIGLNYHQHAKEMNKPVPETPVLFMKPTSAINNPNDPIIIPACCRLGPEVDYEGELAVVIGNHPQNLHPKNIPADNALQFVLGYAIANDVSARKWQQANAGQWVRAKSFDSFCPLGPAIVTPDQIPDPQSLHIRTTLNGQIMQDHHTSDMIFSVAHIIAFLSQDTTLLPGTVILTGTPPGVGQPRKPPVFLKPNDAIAIEIDPIGQLQNPVASA